MSAGQRRLFVAALPAQGGTVELPAESRRHAKVLRLAAGAEVCLFDAAGCEAEATLLSLAQCQARPARTLVEPAPRLCLLLGLPKTDKLELVTRMACELGVRALHPVLTQRSVPQPSAFASRLERLQRITREACAQSGQAFAPQLSEPRPLLEVARQAPAGASKIVFWEDGTQPLAELSREREVWAVIGPEGGLDALEVEALESLGFVAVGLGRARLRVETAAVVAAGLLLERLGRLRPDESAREGGARALAQAVELNADRLPERE
jgi:16S rRNA (uracil1498-N3)-methyltransferase